MPSSNVMNNCSGLAIKDAFERIVRTFVPNEKILGDRNFYRTQTRDRVNTVTAVTLKANMMSEYIAASVLIHCSDAWNYFSRSVDALLNGDIASSIHFAYYAELRSAMSLMAYEGVGIFDRRHVWYDSTKNVDFVLNTTTHKAVDKGMEEWAKTSGKKEVLFKLIKVNNQSLGDWIDATGTSSKSRYVSTIINDWLKKWSIDLHLNEDQSVRNVMSYRPHFTAEHVNIEDMLLKLSEMWKLLEPVSSGGFPLLDRYLLRLAIEGAYSKTTGRAASGNLFKAFIEKTFNNLGEDTTQPLFNFLLREVQPSDAFIFLEAKKDRSDTMINEHEPLPLICRGLLLLRIATGACSELMDNSTLRKDDLRFWWESICYQHGLTSILPSGIDAVDLYTDVRDSIDNIEALGSGILTTVKGSFDSVANELFYMKQFQRSGIWGMGF